MNEILWEPSADQISRSLMWRFMQSLPDQPATYDEVWQWSIDDRAGFWSALWDFAGVIASVPPTATLAVDTLPGAQWFPRARLNFAENLLRSPDDRTAVIAVDESGTTRSVTRRELRSLVAKAQAGFAALGVGVGDRVGGIVPNGFEAIVAMLATSALGAVWSSCSPDFGPLGIVDRFGQIEPKVLVVTDGYRYNGTSYRLQETVSAVVGEISGLSHVVVIETLGEGLDLATEQSTWPDLVADGPVQPAFAQLPFDHPLYVMYSSGTTGPPKSIVHGAGGTLIKHLSEHQLHMDVKPGDVVFWFTTCGWMMWNWLVTALASEAVVVTYDGSPGHPDLGALWRLAADQGITHFGTSPKFLAANANQSRVPKADVDLGAMRVMGSTGAPLNPEQFDWVYENVGSHIQLASVSGGTDIIGCFAAGVPILPVRRGELQARVLGMAVEALGDNGTPVIGAKGELVCTRSFPSLPVRFWNDPGDVRYREAYFSEHPGMWTHGDYIEITPEGGVIIYGRSDTTLNPGGVRIGTAEIYRAIESMPEIVDSIVVGHQAAGDVDVVLCVHLIDDATLDDDLVGRIRDRIRTETTPRHVPRHIFEVPAIPYTLSGKKVEKAVQQTLAGHHVANRDALANPESLEAYTHLLKDPTG